MNITEASKEGIRNWVQRGSLIPPEQILVALEKAKEPVIGNKVIFPILVGNLPPEDNLLEDLKHCHLELHRKGDFWYLDN